MAKSSEEEIFQIPTTCSNCYAECDTNIKEINIPYFKNSLIISTSCDNCGLKSNEVKAGSEILDKGVKYTLKISDSNDLSREILKSEEATIEIPEIEFTVESGTLGGKFSTIEGLLKSMHDHLSTFFCSSNDTSTLTEDSSKMKLFLSKLDKISKGEISNITFILDDPTGNSYMQNVYAPSDDPNLIIEYYERTNEQNENLGINDIKTDI